MGSRKTAIGFDFRQNRDMQLLLNEPQWYAIRTRSRHKIMLQRGIESFLLVKRTHKWSRGSGFKKKSNYRCTGYNFVV